MNQLETGDILLFSNYPSGFFGFFDSLIRWGTQSQYTHIGIVLKDPEFLGLKGLYMWQSGYEYHPDPQDGLKKVGVQITPLEEIIENYKDTGHIFYRKLKCPENLITIEKLKNIHNDVYLKPYDINPIHWITAVISPNSNMNESYSFWCSALVAYIYIELGILKENENWTLKRPSDFSLSGENLIFNKNCFLENKENKLL
jgi:hypothetical protein